MPPLLTLAKSRTTLYVAKALRLRLSYQSTMSSLYSMAARLTNVEKCVRQSERRSLLMPGIGSMGRNFPKTSRDVGVEHTQPSLKVVLSDLGCRKLGALEANILVEPSAMRFTGSYPLLKNFCFRIVS